MDFVGYQQRQKALLGAKVSIFGFSLVKILSEWTRCPSLVFRWCLVSVKESIIYRERGKAFQMVKAIWEAALYQPWWTGKTDKNKPGIKEVLVMAGVQDKKSKPSMSMGGPSGWEKFCTGFGNGQNRQEVLSDLLVWDGNKNHQGTNSFKLSGERTLVWKFTQSLHIMLLH